MNQDLRRVLVTGANKGIGLAIVEAILEHAEDTRVFLGSRDEARGRDAVASLVAAHPAWSTRLELVPIDVAREDSVSAAAASVRARGVELYGLVNNAAIGVGSGTLRSILETNTLGLRRVTEAFLPLVQKPGGRIVNISSASGPLFVSSCSPERQRELVDASITRERFGALVDECLALSRPEGDDGAGFAARGLGDGSAYGLSKALVNAYTMIVAREHPELHVNACTPGFIATDMTRAYADAAGKSPEEMGMKPPSSGAKAPAHLLFAELEGNGRFYGSDAKRSPLDRYRAPGSPTYVD